jgi:metallo-beta-lactamase class B
MEQALFGKPIFAIVVPFLAAAAPALATQESPPPIMIDTSMAGVGEITPGQWARRCEDWDDWDKPVEPFKIAPGVHYVGTCGITVLFIETKSGHVLIDTGTEKGVLEAFRNILAMRKSAASIGLILYSHEHFDHVGGMAYAQSFTGAPVVAPAGTVEVFRTGKDDPRDPQAGLHEPMRPAPHVIEIEAGKPITYGGITFSPIATPGHTPGALTWQWEACEGEVCKTIVYADSLSAISGDGYKFSDHPEYVVAFRAGIERLRGLKCDILLTPHPSASNMIERAATGTFEGGMTCAQYADSKMQALDERLAEEAAGQ